MRTPKLDRETLLIDSSAPLSARTTAIGVWQKCFPEWTPLVVEVVDGGCLVALALLGWRRRRGGWIDVIRLGPQDEAGCVASLDVDAALRLAADIRRALDALGRPWRLRLVNLCQSERTTAALVSELALAHVRIADHSAELDVSSRWTFASIVSRNNRAAVAKARNRLTREKRRLDLLWLSAPADVLEALPLVLCLHQARNAQLSREQFTTHPEIAEYVRERIVAHGEEHRVELLLTCVDRRLAAFALCFRDGRVLRVFANLTSPAWLPYSTGAIANHEVIARAWADSSIDAVDWGLGLQRYKLSGRVEIVPHQMLEGFSSKAAKACVGAVETLHGWRDRVRGRLAG